MQHWQNLIQMPIHPSSFCLLRAGKALHPAPHGQSPTALVTVSFPRKGKKEEGKRKNEKNLLTC